VFQIGPHLAEQRHRRGLTLADCEAATKIRAKYLAALEEERFDELPDPEYVRIFLRDYATFLGLDAGMLLTELVERRGDDGLLAQHQLVPLEPPPPGSLPSLGRWLTRRHRPSRRREALVVGAVLTIALGMLFWLGSSGGGPASRQPTASVVAPTTTLPAKVDLTHAHKAAADASSLTLTDTGAGGSYVLIRRGTITGAVVYAGTLTPGASMHIRVTQQLWMRVGWAPNLHAVLGAHVIVLSGGTGNFTISRTGIAATS